MNQNALVRKMCAELEAITSTSNKWKERAEKAEYQLEVANKIINDLKENLKLAELENTQFAKRFLIQEEITAEWLEKTIRESKMTSCNF